MTLWGYVGKSPGRSPSGARCYGLAPPPLRRGVVNLKALLIFFQEPETNLELPVLVSGGLSHGKPTAPTELRFNQLYVLP